jgi:sulfite exporter TauE/SafE
MGLEVPPLPEYRTGWGSAVIGPGPSRSLVMCFGCSRSVAPPTRLSNRPFEGVLDKCTEILHIVVAMTPFAAAIVGLSTGGLTCLAVQGGLLVGLLARRDDGSDQQLSGWQRLVLPVSAFLVAKVIVYTLAGFVLGWLGSAVQLSNTAKLWLQAAAAIFMILTGLRLFWPRLFPWLALTPPAGVRRFIRQHGRSQALFAPAILGFLTILIPCGTTQSMEVNAIASGSAVQGALIMFAFTLGTAPLFFLLGLLAKGSALIQRRLTLATAAIVISLGLYSFNGVLVATGSHFSWQYQTAALRYILSGAGRDETPSSEPIAANQTIVVNPIGYEPNYVRVPANEVVTFTLATNNNTGCTSVFRIPALKIERILPATGNTVVTGNFTKPGRYAFTCGMGMFTGTIEAV